MVTPGTVGEGAADEAALRLVVRHQWVRDLGTPRLTTLVGSVVDGSALWRRWLGLGGREPGPLADAATTGVLIEQPRAPAPAWFDRTVADALARIAATPRVPVAIAAEAAIVDAWLTGRADRAAALVSEGLIRLAPAPRGRAQPAPGRTRTSRARDGGSRWLTGARSLAELTLHEALEATPATAGRFALNQHLAFVFGSTGAEIDLLSRADGIAIEVDGIHHFEDAERYRRDRRKDLLIQIHGYRIVRVLADDVLRDPSAAVRAVCELLAAKPPPTRGPR